MILSRTGRRCRPVFAAAASVRPVTLCCLTTLTRTSTAQEHSGAARHEQRPLEPHHQQDVQQQQQQQQQQHKPHGLNEKDKQERGGRGLELLLSAVQEVRLARKDLGWGVDEVAMRITMLSLLRGRNKGKRGGIPREATSVEGDWWADRASEWERFLRWAHASYGWNEDVVVKRSGLTSDEVEIVMFSRGKARNRAMAPNYVLAADHRRREIVLAIRGTKGIGDAITITHFLPEPFLDGYAHRGFAKSTYALVKEVEPQLAALTARLPDYRVFFTGHSMGGGIAAMASMLIRDSTQRRHQHNEQQQPTMATAPPVSEQALEQCRSTSTNSTPRNDQSTTEVSVGSTKRKEALMKGGAGLGGMGAADTNNVEGRGSDRGGGPVCYSFATPSCVSLELARGCRSWVESLVHADDAVPRLSTVSLELLKEDMTAADWRRAVDKLRGINKVLPSADAATATVKDLFAGIGTLGLGEKGTDGGGGLAKMKGEGKDDGPIALEGLEAKEGRAVVAAARQGKEVNDLGKSIRDTALTLRGLAKLYPLSQSVRREISSVVSQVMSRTGGDKDDRDHGHNEEEGSRERTPTADGDGNGNADGDDSEEGSKSWKLAKRKANEISEAAAAVAASASLSQPALLLALKENLTSLGASRAALNRGSGGGEDDVLSAVAQDRSPDPSISSSGSNGMGAGESNASATSRLSKSNIRGDDSAEAESRSTSLEGHPYRRSNDDSDATKNADDDDHDDDDDDDDDERLRFLHDYYLNQEEPSFHPLYPPGDAFLMCSNSNDKRDDGSSPSSSSSEYDGVSGPTGGAMGAAVVAAARSAAERLEFGGLAGSTDRASDGDGEESDKRMSASEAREVNSDTRDTEESAARSTTAARGRNTGVADAESKRHRRRRGIGNGDGLGLGSDQEENLVLVRVPHRHFLRMPLSPSMIEDHSMVSYIKAFAALRR